MCNVRFAPKTKLKEQQEIFGAYEQKTAEINKVRENGLKTRKDLFDYYANLMGCYNKIIAKLIEEKYSKIDTDIVLVASLGFDFERFSASFSDLYDRRRTSFRTIFGPVFNENNEFQFDELSHVQNIYKIYEKVSPKPSAEILLRKGVTQNDAIEQLFKNYFKIEYDIRYKNDEILDMSPGKRGLVLLQLILHISNATHPILIDQPEDNLDNRTISNELKQFITTKKLTRQMIMVTHDANLVVLTDAENIIVSNQDGQQVNRENAIYRFEYVAGALENSFRMAKDQVSKGILFSCGIREHVCDILEGGEAAFKKREEKYGFSNR
jgi:ABC-type lipoprotein export system ATPase subunit